VEKRGQFTSSRKGEGQNQRKRRPAPQKKVVKDTSDERKPVLGKKTTASRGEKEKKSPSRSARKLWDGGQVERKET